MKESSEDLASDIVYNISELILRELSCVAHEEHFPCSDPDKMDSIISIGKNKATRLRKLREDFENIKSGVLI